MRILMFLIAVTSISDEFQFLSNHITYLKENKSDDYLEANDKDDCRLSIQNCDQGDK